MSDYTKLKELALGAESVKPGRWFVHSDGLGPQFDPHPHQNFGVDDGQGCVVVWHGVGRSGGIPHEEVAEHIAAASPAAVLALIAENERLVPFEEAYQTACKVRNRLIKDNELLDRLIVENKAISDSFRVERDQLKAENEALRKDSEAYRLLSFCHGQGTLELVQSHRELCAEIRRLKILSGEPVPPTPDEFVGPSPEGPTARIRRKISAMGKGEQS